MVGWGQVILLMSEIKVPMELHAPTSSTEKLKLIERGGQFTYTPMFPLDHVEAPSGLKRGIRVSNNYFI